MGGRRISVLLRGGSSGIEPGRRVRLKPANVCLPPGTKAKLKRDPTHPARVGQLCTVINTNVERRQCLVRMERTAPLAPDPLSSDANSDPVPPQEDFVVPQAVSPPNTNPAAAAPRPCLSLPRA